MTLSADQIRERFATIRRLVAYSGPPGSQVCRFEEDLIDLADRERRAPTMFTVPDGFPTGGEGGPRSSDRTSSTERAALAENREDPIGPRVIAALDFLDQAAMSSNVVRHKVTEASQVSSLRRSIGQVAAVCVEEGCDELATRKGRCDTDRKYLERHPEVQCVPREVIEARKTKVKRYEHQPEDAA